MKLMVKCNLHFHVLEQTALILMLRPFRGASQWIHQETFSISPDTLPILESTDSFGNSYQRLLAPMGDFYIRSSAEVRVAETTDTAPGADFIEIQHLPNDTLPYLLPSRYCESDRFGDLAREITVNVAPGYDQVLNITQWVSRSIEYLPGTSEIPLSATEIHHRGYGVCRDLAQLCIALCRSISIPARLAVGFLYQLQPMDLHAWFEAFVGNRWYTFDPTQVAVSGGRVIIAYGRDAADVAIFHQFGSGCVLNKMDVEVDLLDNYTTEL